MDFNIQNHAVVKLGGIELWITDSIISTWAIMAALILLAVIVRLSIKNWKKVPKGFQNVIELMVETFDRFVRNTAGEKMAYIGNWYFMVFAFILTSNLLGLVPFASHFLRPPTADWSVTFTLAVITLILMHGSGAKYHGGLGQLKSLFEPHPLFSPINIIGELARPVALSFRLFGNVLAGLILSSLLYSLAPKFALFGPPAIVHGYFDLFSGAIQTYIFTVLSLSFIGGAAATD